MSRHPWQMWHGTEDLKMELPPAAFDIGLRIERNKYHLHHRWLRQMIENSGIWFEGWHGSKPWTLIENNGHETSYFTGLCMVGPKDTLESIAQRPTLEDWAFLKTLKKLTNKPFVWIPDSAYEITLGAEGRQQIRDELPNVSNRYERFVKKHIPKAEVLRESECREVLHLSRNDLCSSKANLGPLKAATSMADDLTAATMAYLVKELGEEHITGVLEPYERKTTQMANEWLCTEREIPMHIDKMPISLAGVMPLPDRSNKEYRMWLANPSEVIYINESDKSIRGKLDSASNGTLELIRTLIPSADMRCSPTESILKEVKLARGVT